MIETKDDKNENASAVRVGHQQALMHHPAAVEASPSPPKNEGSVPTRLSDHALLLQGRRHPEARDLRWIKYGCCSNSVFTCYKRRFLPVQQHPIRSGTGHGFGCGDRSCVDRHQRHVDRVFSVLCSPAVY